MVTIGLHERLICPPEYQAILTKRFGVNVYGKPIFRIIWGQTETLRVANPDGGYKDMSVGGNVAKWLVQQWRSPLKWGTRALFNIVNADFDGRPLYEFPEFGMYETVTSLPHLEYAIIDWIIPKLIQFAALSHQQIKAAKEWKKAVQEKAEVEVITDKLMDAMPTRYGPTSYGRGGCRTSVLDKKMAEISIEWQKQERAIRNRKLLPKGLSQAADIKI
jgi:hypothetical protein